MMRGEKIISTCKTGIKFNFQAQYKVQCHAEKQLFDLRNKSSFEIREHIYIFFISVKIVFIAKCLLLPALCLGNTIACNELFMYMAEYSELKWQLTNILIQGESLISDIIMSWSSNTFSGTIDCLFIYIIIHYIMNLTVLNCSLPLFIYSFMQFIYFTRQPFNVLFIREVYFNSPNNN